MNYLKCYPSLKRHTLLLDAQNWYAVWGEKYIYTLLYSLVSKYKAEWDKWQQDLGRFMVWSILFVTELRHTTNDQRRKRSDYWWGSEVQETRYAPKTEWLWPAYSFWWRLWLFFSVSSWQSSTASLRCFCTSTARIPALLLLLLCLNSIVLLLLFYAACSFKSISRPPSSLYSLQCCWNTNRNWSTISICSHVSHIMESASKHTLLSPSKSVLQSILSYLQLKYPHHRYICTVLRISQQKTHYFEYKSWPKWLNSWGNRNDTGDFIQHVSNTIFHSESTF